jgi:crossover junction endodeoxyribonuclease RusA
MTAIRPVALDRPPYERSAPVLVFTVHGLPKPQGSKSAFISKKTGKLLVTEAVKDSPAWRRKVRDNIALGMRATPPPLEGWPLLGPIAVDLIFTMPRPVSHPKRRRTWPFAKPDVDKLTRAVLDAGTQAKLWLDDAQVVDVHAAKAYPLEAPGALASPGVHAVVYLVGDRPMQPVGKQEALL